ncbi:anaerobic ribonucleoside-triphosphate reductase activating protein [Candidatus Kuenenbacteria bacterium HGW-Kuenenbacteria-1]|uniref:Anaerobic ribonucleoside-triphosphate reductase activating protein n=1 Tax=Candidatus Kuenenbacteria bacterium HGW-Kuenenbacteria-1 TaxID=2013812 RepID=A0A2N1UMZ6_9BACT|nr:MAG: anaerobic ribonucleoside-triphosphate reductase activating protein [Candidatus Kuenenbacteria bacterium HGW-Kuenenbacteria-1]
MLIGGLQKVSLIDYPDKICAIIFTKGCNFKCGFCHNSGLVLFDKQQSTIKEEKIFEFLEKRKKRLDGICITGGEPTLQKDLPEFLNKIKKMGFLIKLDTNGTNPEMLKKIIKKKLVDYIAMDIKAPFSKYENITGAKVDLNKTKQSIKIIMNFSDYEFRTTIVPNLIKEEDIVFIAKQIQGAKKYFLQQFVFKEKMIDEKYKKIKPYSKEILEKMCNKAKKYIKIVENR